MKARLYITLFIFLSGNFCFANDSAEVYEKEGNIYINDVRDEDIQLTFKNKDYGPLLSPDGQTVVFIRHVKPSPYNSNKNIGWIPSDYDEIWSINIEENNPHPFIKNNYSKGIDMSNYLGSFGSLHFSPDGKKIYFLSQNCASNALLYIANEDGSNIRKIRSAHGLDGVIGGSPEDEFYGYLVAHVKKVQKNSIAYRWTSVLLDPDGNEIKEIEDLDQFWHKHEKL